MLKVPFLSCTVIEMGSAAHPAPQESTAQAATIAALRSSLRRFRDDGLGNMVLIPPLK
jgi:hypothetical protein